MIESRYTIEYVNPDSEGHSESNKSLILLTFLGLIIVAALVYAFFSISQSNDFVRVSDNTQKQTTEIVSNTEKEYEEKKEIPILISTPKVASKTSDNPIQAIQQEIDKLLLSSKTQAPKPTKQLVTNKKLSQSINDLTKQLMAERKKNKALDKQLNSQKNENNQLSNLLENALSKASKSDKNYLSALSKLEKTTKQNENIEIKTKNKVKVNTLVVANSTQKSKNTNSFNSVSLSTNSQVDAIIAAMQSINKTPSKIIKTNIDKIKEIQVAAVSQTSPTELLHIQLQQQIDQIILTKKSVSPKTKTVYKKALEEESNIRENAVRSITIKKGETLWSIAQRAYGNGSFYNKIIEANSQTDLKRLFVGQVIRVPK